MLTRFIRRHLATTAIAAVSASGLSLAAAPLVAHAANETCAQLAADLPGATNGAVFTLSDNHLCTQAYTIPTGVNVTIQGADPTQGFDGQDNHQIIRGTDVGATIIQNLVFKNGNAPGPSSGGAIFLNGAVGPSILNNTFQHNHANTAAGAVWLNSFVATGGPVTVSGNNFGSAADASQGNTAIVDGGALELTSGSNVTVTNNTFASNAAQRSGGGARIVLNTNGVAGTLTLSGNQFLANTAADNGGGADVETRDPVQSTISNNLFRQNRLTTANNGSGNHMGGGLFLGYPPLFLVMTPTAANQSQNVFDSNVIEPVLGVDPPSARPNIFLGFDYGGGGEWVTDVQVSSTRDRFINNTVMASDPAINATPVGGGLGVRGANRETTFTGNDLVAAGNTVGAGGEGAGIYSGLIVQRASHLVLFDSTVAGNTEGTGGTVPGISGNPQDTLAVTNTIVAGNSGGGDQAGGFQAMSATFSDLCLSGGTAPAGAGNFCADPKLVNPGPGTADVHETLVSPTIDLGSSALVPSGLSVDYEADPRIAGTSVDVGADEFEVAGAQAPALPQAGFGSGDHSLPVAAGVALSLLAVVAVGSTLWRLRRDLTSL